MPKLPKPSPKVKVVSESTQPETVSLIDMSNNQDQLLRNREGKFLQLKSLEEIKQQIQSQINEISQTQENLSRQIGPEAIFNNFLTGSALLPNPNQLSSISNLDRQSDSALSQYGPIEIRREPPKKIIRIVSQVNDTSVSNENLSNVRTSGFSTNNAKQQFFPADFSRVNTPNNQKIRKSRDNSPKSTQNLINYTTQ